MAAAERLAVHPRADHSRRAGARHRDVLAALAWAIRDRSLPAEALPDRRVLYVALALVSATLFGAAAFSAGRLPAPRRGASEDDWWQANLGRVLVSLGPGRGADRCSASSPTR